MDSLHRKICKSYILNTILEDIRCFRELCNEGSANKVCHRLSKDSQESVESDPRTGRAATSRTPENVERIWAAINEDQRVTVRELEADLGIPKTTVSETVTQDLSM